MEFFSDMLGLDAEKLEPYQMVTRAFVIFFTSLMLLRISGIRTLGRQSAFDTLTSLMLGAISRSHITEEDIMEALRHDVNITSLDKIKKVYLERSGEIT